MRKFKMGLITLAASAAVIVPAASAVAGTSGTSSATTASSGTLIEIKDVDTDVVLTVVDLVDIGDVCVLNGNQIITLLSGTDVVCNNDSHKKAHKK